MANYGAGHFAARKKRRLAEQEPQWRVVMGLEDFTVRGKDERAAYYQARLVLEKYKGYRRQDFADVDMELTRVEMPARKPPNPLEGAY